MYKQPSLYLGLCEGVLKFARVGALADRLQPQTLQLLRLQLREGTLAALTLREEERRDLKTVLSVKELQYCKASFYDCQFANLHGLGGLHIFLILLVLIVILSAMGFSIVYLVCLLVTTNFN